MSCGELVKAGRAALSGGVREAAVVLPPQGGAAH